jgi:hypothetical protein
MNTVIADLMEQAFDRCKKYDDEGNTGLVKTTEAFAIFAELIIKECVDIACNYDKPKLSGPGLAIACNIESHFDVYTEEDGRFVK